MLDTLSRRHILFGMVALPSGPIAAWVSPKLESLYVASTCFRGDIAWCAPSAWQDLAVQAPNWALGFAACGFVSWAFHEMVGRNQSHDFGVAIDRLIPAVAIAISVLVTKLALASSQFPSLIGS
jgi:hypothetical protein